VNDRRGRVFVEINDVFIDVFHNQFVCIFGHPGVDEADRKGRSSMNTGT